MSSGVVIAGAGQGGFQTALSLRTEGYEEPITLIGDEPWLPYQRPPLSKGFLTGKHDIDAILLRPEAWYENQRITLLTGERVGAIDHANSRVELESGSHVPYQKLVLATGAINRRFTVEGADLDGVCYLRTRDEAADVLQRLEAAGNVVVIGGGFIGLEVAAAAHSLGKSVVVVEAEQRLMQRAVAPVISEFYRELHGGHGVTLLFGRTAQRLCGRCNEVREVLLSDGTVLEADLVIVGIGVTPNTSLALNSGLALANGIAVDAFLRTDAGNIYAIGDCADYPSRFAGGRIRLESVQNAVDQARCVAASVAGRPHPYDAVPWFWTDQFDIKLQMVGLSQGCDRVVTLGTPESRKFSVCYFSRNKLVAVDSVNRPGDHMAGRKLLASGTRLTPDAAGAPGFDIKQYSREQI
jgi:3-phenylpropionate/trans-cinnamate dioxygenase ferredoxin reductase component